MTPPKPWPTLAGPCLPKALALVSLLCFSMLPCAAQFASSSFDEDDDGWSIADFNVGVPYTSPSSLLAADWNAAGGDPGGYIVRRDPSSGIYFFNAPVKFLGDLSGLAGGALQFSLRSDREDYSADNVVVLVGVLGGNPRAIVAEINIPSTSWGQYSIPLIPERFRYDNKNGGLVSGDDFLTILRNVTALRISAEYGSIVVETTALDSVRLIPPCDGGVPSVAIAMYPVVAIEGNVGCPYRIEFTSDLEGGSWLTLTNFALPQSPYLYIDTSWTSADRRFYRVVADE